MSSLKNRVLLMILPITAFLIHPLYAQNQENINNPLIISLGARLFPQGHELSFSHKLSQKFNIRTSVGHNFRSRDQKSYSDREFTLSVNGNGRDYPYGLGLGSYFKLKDSNYSYQPPDENLMLDAYSSLYFFGIGINADYNQRIGKRFILSPFICFGYNRVIIRKDEGPGTNPFTDNYEADFNAGFRVGFVF